MFIEIFGTVLHNQASHFRGFLFKPWPGGKVSVNSGIISLSKPPLFSTAYNAWQFRWQPQVQEIQGKGSYLHVHLRMQKMNNKKSYCGQSRN
jgi:hypothetical protein